MPKRRQSRRRSKTGFNEAEALKPRMHGATDIDYIHMILLQ